MKIKVSQVMQANTYVEPTRFDRWFNAVTGCLLNIVLAGLVLVSYSA